MYDIQAYNLLTYTVNANTKEQGLKEFVLVKHSENE